MKYHTNNHNIKAKDTHMHTNNITSYPQQHIHTYSNTHARRTHKNNHNHMLTSHTYKIRLKFMKKARKKTTNQRNYERKQEEFVKPSCYRVFGKY